MAKSKSASTVNRPPPREGRSRRADSHRYSGKPVAAIDHLPRDSLVLPTTSHWLERQNLVDLDKMEKRFPSRHHSSNPTALSWLMIGFVAIWNRLFLTEGIEGVLKLVFSDIASTTLGHDIARWVSEAVQRNVLDVISRLAPGLAAPPQGVKLELAELLKWLLNAHGGHDFEATESVVLDFCYGLSITGFNLTTEAAEREGQLLVSVSISHPSSPFKRASLTVSW